MTTIRLAIFASDTYDAATIASVLRQSNAQRFDVVSVLDWATLTTLLRTDPYTLLILDDNHLLLTTLCQQLETIHSRYPALLMMVISSRVNLMRFERYSRAGVKAYVDTREHLTRHYPRIVDALLGEDVHIPKKVTKQLLQAGGRDLTDALTPEYQRIIELTGRGKSVDTIHQLLGVSKRTVQRAREQVMHLLHAENLAHMVSLAKELGIIDDPL